MHPPASPWPHPPECFAQPPIPRSELRRLTRRRAQPLEALLDPAVVEEINAKLRFLRKTYPLAINERLMVNASRGIPAPSYIAPMESLHDRLLVRMAQLMGDRGIAARAETNQFAPELRFNAKMLTPELEHKLEQQEAFWKRLGLRANVGNSPASTTAHEYGHFIHCELRLIHAEESLVGVVGRFMGKPFDKFGITLRERVALAREVSLYGISWNELVAELFAGYVCDASPGKLAIQAGYVFDRYLHQDAPGRIERQRGLLDGILSLSPAEGSNLGSYPGAGI